MNPFLLFQYIVIIRALNKTFPLGFCSLITNLSKFIAMKNLQLFPLTIIVFCLIFSCSSSRKSSEEQTGKRRSTLTSVKPNVKNPNRAVLNASGDGLTPGIAQNNGAGSEENAASIANNAINKAGAAARAAQQKSGNLSDEDFINKVAVSEMMEMLISRSIQKTTANKKIKDYAAVILNDNLKIQSELKMITENKHIVLADSVNSGLQSVKASAEKMETSNANGQGDLEYVQMMIADLQSTIRLFEAGSRSKDPVINAFAVKHLPLLRKHLEDAQELTIEVSPKR